MNKAEATTEQVRKDAAANGGCVELVELDLANLKSVRACADRLVAKGEAFDVVIANAGVMTTPFDHTADGFETQFGTNHLGHFVLVNRIAALIRTGGRLINVSSAGHRRSNVDLEDPNLERTSYEPYRRLWPREDGEHSLCGCLRQTNIGTAACAPRRCIRELSRQN